jgi:hypothetical protein
MKKIYNVFNLNISISTLFFAMLVCSFANAQTYQWAKSIGGNNGEGGNSIAVDASGNVYVTGYFAATSDFDPGVGTVNLTSNGVYDIFFAKYDSNGNYLWAKSIGSTSSDYGNSITVDASGNVYITGYYQATADFDPGTGTANLTSVAGWDAFFAKYDSNGNYIFAKSIGGTTNQTGRHITLDASGNIYIAGYFGGTMDFDPGPGVASSTSAGNLDTYFAKYDNNGNYLWGKSIGGTSVEDCYNIKVDAGGNVYVAGFFSLTVDFDPSIGTANLTSAGGHDIFFAKYDNNGNYLWANRVGAANDDTGKDIAIDASGGIYITGDYQGTADFDSGSGIANLTAAGMNDIFLTKYDASGNYLWAKSIGGTNDDNCYSIGIDGGENIYLTGVFDGTADFDPSAATATITTIGMADIFIAKYDNNGNYIWAKNMGSTNNEYSNCITVDAAGIFYITGQYGSTVDFDPGAGTATLTSVVGTTDTFFAKYFSCTTAPLAPVLISGSTTICSSSTNTYSVTPVVNASSYNWTFPSGWLGTSTSNSIAITTSTSTTLGTYTISVSAQNPCGASPTQTLAVNLSSPSSNFVFATDTVCSGSAITLAASDDNANIINYNWYNSSQTICNSSSCSSISPSPTTNVTYSLTVTDVNSCTQTYAKAITVRNLPVVTYVQSPDTFCFNSGLISLNPATPTGGVFSCTVGVSGNNFDPSISGSGTFNVKYTYTDTYSCSNADSSLITIDLCTNLSNTLSEGADITLFPNPVKQILYVDLPSGTDNTISITNTLGEELLEISHTKSKGNNINLSEFQPGVYFVRIHSFNKLVIKKIVKE